MAKVRVSPKFQVVIPKMVRKGMGLEAGRDLQVFQFDNRIELVPVEPIRNLRGMLKGIDTRIERGKDRP